MAAFLAVKFQNEPMDYLEFCRRFNGNADGESDESSWQRLRTQVYLQSGGQVKLW
jgi:hypothetical protein